MSAGTMSGDWDNNANIGELVNIEEKVSTAKKQLEKYWQRKH